MGLSTSRSTDIVAERITRILTAILAWVSAHWLLLANLAIGLYAGLPFLAPVLMFMGYDRPARLIYTVFKPLCHQLPERSYFLFGQQAVYSLSQLGQLLGGQVPQRYIGAPGIGYKVAICERDVAIYLAMLLAGIVFNLLRSRLKPLPLKAFGLLIVPMAVDGFGQLFGLWTSSWLSRTITGGLFGLACVWLTFPYLETGMRDVRREMADAQRAWRR